MCLSIQVLKQSKKMVVFNNIFQSIQFTFFTEILHFKVTFFLLLRSVHNFRVFLKLRMNAFYNFTWKSFSSPSDLHIIKSKIQNLLLIVFHTQLTILQNTSLNLYLINKMDQFFFSDVSSQKITAVYVYSEGKD